jgi:PAS domain S-box-containing protein
MSIDPQTIRSEEHHEVGELIRRDAGLLIERWSRRAVAEEPTAPRVHHAALLDHLPRFLDALGRNLAESDPEENGEHAAVAADHGEQRWESGWSLPEVVRDYQILRLVILEYLEENLERPLSSREAMAVGLALDEAITASVGMYVKNREHYIRQVEEERAQEERRAREELRRWEQVFQSAGCGVAVVAPEDNALKAFNHAFARMHGYPVEELRDVTLDALVAPTARAELAEHLRRADGDGHQVYELTHLRKDGSEFPVLTDVTAFRDQEGRVLYRAANFQDISERKALEEALRQRAESLMASDRRKDEFLAQLAHELRNPLAPILNSVQVLSLLRSADPTLIQVREILERQTRQMAHLVDDLLDLSRIARGQVQLRREPLDLAAAVRQAVQTSQPLLQSRRHRLTVELPPVPVRLEADEARLVQVLTNLLNNAAKYTDPGGHIELRAEREGDQAVLRVRDNGVGIPPEMLPRVFDLFTQVEQSRARSDGGLGIGLALVQRLVELHGGTVTAFSAGLGRGSEFIVRLPALPETAPGSARAGVAVGLHILIADANPDSRETLRTLLGLLGHRAEAAGDGNRGLELALASRPQVALIDLHLPGLDGPEVARRARAALGDRTFLIALTDSGEPGDRERAAGFDAHLAKPVDLQELNALLARVPRQP